MSLPVRQPTPLDDTLAPFPPPEQAEAEPHVIAKLAGRNRTITEDPMTGDVTVTVHRERASYHLPAIDLGFEADAEEHYRIREGDAPPPPPKRAPHGGYRAVTGAPGRKPLRASPARRKPSRSRPLSKPLRASRAWQAASGVEHFARQCVT